MKKNNRILLISLLFCIATGLVCEYFYHISPRTVIDVKKFGAQLDKKEKRADTTLEDIKQIIIHTSIDSLIHYPFTDNDISYYVFEKNQLRFWSDNHSDINSIPLSDSTEWQYRQLPNMHCVYHTTGFDSIRILAVVNIKYNFPYENDELTNDFVTGFDIDKHVRIVNGNISDQYAIKGMAGNYLFSLSEPETPIYNEAWSTVGLIAFSFAFILFLLLYVRVPLLFNKKAINLKTYSVISGGTAIFVGLCLYFRIPSLLFVNKIFTPFQYAYNPLLASINHLTVASGFILATCYLFFFHVNVGKNTGALSSFGRQLVYGLYFVLFYMVLSGLIFHSSIQLRILQFNDFSFISIWIHLIILVWGIGLALVFFKTHKILYKQRKLKQAFVTDIVLTLVLTIGTLLISSGDVVRLIVSYTAIWLVFYLPFIVNKQKNIYSHIAIWTFVFTAFVVWNSQSMNRLKQNDKFKIIAQNIYINGNTENDRMADILLEELDVQISNDKKIGGLIRNTDSLSVANEYLNKTYLRGFWNKYEMRLNAAPVRSYVYSEYAGYIAEVGTRLKETHFYSVPASESNMSYIGVFQPNDIVPDSIAFFMEFYPRRQFKSYSFPNLLITSAPDIQSQLNITIAKYEHKKLVYSSGNTSYPDRSDWIPTGKSGFFRVTRNNHEHFVYMPDTHTCIVITEQQVHKSLNYILYFIYTFIAYLILCWLIVWFFLRLRRKNSYRLGLTTKFQYAFITLLIISFLGIFYVSVDFIRKKYQKEQIANLESKKNYIQKALQDLYYWNQDLSAENMQSLNFDLQDLSYTFHTDIHVYNNSGELIGSSQPLIFNKSLISNRISPVPYFSPNANMNQYEHIGNLKYLTGYTDFYNGDYLQIGYIAVPQFFSQDEIRGETESFLSVVIHIYFIIILLAVFLSILIGRQLSAPLNMLENKLKEMRLGRRNEKIDYALNDEIGQLVLQYNRTVDELEKSAKLLAKSERESAWKSMARQVAHEINNPLTPMKLTIQQLQRTKKMNDERFDDYFEKSTVMLIEQIDNLSRIAGTFSNFARMPEANFEKVDIAARLFSAVQLFANNNENTRLNYTGDEKNVFVYADPEQLAQVFNNLLKNAIQAIPKNLEGIINVNLQQSGDQVIIEVTDNGIGIDKEIHDKLFIPNFTTKSTGMGLGLAIAKNIIDLSNGKISFRTEAGKGTTFTVKLPKAD